MSDIVPEVPISATPAMRTEIADRESLFTETFWKKAYGSAYSIVKHREDAEDITQEVFVELFRETESGQRIEHVGAWMRTVARRIAFRRYRELRPNLHVPLETTNDEGDHFVIEPVDPAPSAERRVIDEGLLRLGAKVLCQFSEKDRQCIVMYFRGYDFPQISTRLQVSRWTARRITLKALKKLQARVDLLPK